MTHDPLTHFHLWRRHCSAPALLFFYSVTYLAAFQYKVWVGSFVRQTYSARTYAQTVRPITVLSTVHIRSLRVGRISTTHHTACRLNYPRLRPRNTAPNDAIIGKNTHAAIPLRLRLSCRLQLGPTSRVSCLATA